MAFAGTLTACYDDKIVRAYGAQRHIWVRTELNGDPSRAAPRLALLKRKNSWERPLQPLWRKMSVAYPWFEISEITTTKMACPGLVSEAAFLDALRQASLSEVIGNTLILSNPDGLSIGFKVAG